MNRRFLVPLIVGCVIAIAVSLAFYGAGANWFGFNLNHQIDPVNLFTLGVSVFIAFFLQYYLATRVTDDRAEKDILIDTVRDVFNMLRACRDELNECYGGGKIPLEKQRKLILLYRNLSNGLENIETAIRMSRYKAVASEFDSVREKYYKYKAAGTGKFPRAPDVDDIGFQGQTYRALNQELHSLAFKINQYR